MSDVIRSGDLLRLRSRPGGWARLWSRPGGWARLWSRPGGWVRLRDGITPWVIPVSCIFFCIGSWADFTCSIPYQEAIRNPVGKIPSYSGWKGDIGKKAHITVEIRTGMDAIVFSKWVADRFYKRSLNKLGDGIRKKRRKQNNVIFVRMLIRRAVREQRGIRVWVGARKRSGSRNKQMKFKAKFCNFEIL